MGSKTPISSLLRLRTRDTNCRSRCHYQPSRRKLETYGIFFASPGLSHRLTEILSQYSLIQLVQTFSTPTATVAGPHHPHLHTNGSFTHPVILLFNALITGKRIVFLGHNRPAGQVASYVLSACALGSGCGSILRGFVERAFPYAHLTNREEWESMYVRGCISSTTVPVTKCPHLFFCEALGISLE